MPLGGMNRQRRPRTRAAAAKYAKFENAGPTFFRARGAACWRSVVTVDRRTTKRLVSLPQGTITTGDAAVVGQHGLRRTLSVPERRYSGLAATIATAGRRDCGAVVPRLGRRGGPSHNDVGGMVKP